MTHERVTTPLTVRENRGLASSDNGRRVDLPMSDGFVLDLRQHTVVARPALCPELQLHLITPSCPLWKATEKDLLALGIDEPYWAFAWPGGQALARYILDDPGRWAGRRVLDFGAGGGVEAMAAALCGARVWATDLDPRAEAACRANARLNGVEDRVHAETIDVLGRVDLEVDAVVIGDVTYEDSLAERVADWAEALAARGLEVLVADPGRGFLDERFPVVATYAAPSDIDVDGQYLVPTCIRRP